MKSYQEINEKIKKGTAVVLTAEEVSKLATEKSAAEIAKTVDVVTTGTFGPMCSSGMFLNVGHYDPPIRMEHITLNGVEVHAGVAAVDMYIGATACNPAKPTYGGAHIIEELIAGKDVELIASGKGTDCYPTQEIKTHINKSKVNEMILFNPRNAYQNYPVAVNNSGKIKYTYMGSLLPKLGNANYSTSGELSPLLNDPDLRTIGIGTRIFLGGTTGYVSWYGTQFKTDVPRTAEGVPTVNAATISVIGNAKDMSTDFIRAAYYEKYGVSIFIGIGIPIPILDEEMAKAVMIRNEQIVTKIVDYGNIDKPVLGEVNYKQLMSGEITLHDKKIKTASMSSLHKARIIADQLKGQIQSGSFTLTEPVEAFPKNTSLNSLEIR
ncbi:homocysteine biosynthesis protein [Bacteroidota bacterium]